MPIAELNELYPKAFPFWSTLSQSEKDILLNASLKKSYKKGDTVHDGDTECTGAVLVRKGCLRAYILSEDGREITIYRLRENDICMLSASCVLKAITFDVFIDAETDSECIVIRGNAFASVSEKNVYAENFALNIAVERFSDVMWLMQQILFMSFDRRLAVFLIDETAESGSDTVGMTHEQIAKYVGSAREVVSRMLKYFESEGMVALSRKGVRITDRKRLRSLAG